MGILFEKVTRMGRQLQSWRERKGEGKGREERKTMASGVVKLRDRRV
jgi:hypothetical protein